MIESYSEARAHALKEAGRTGEAMAVYVKGPVGYREFDVRPRADDPPAGYPVIWDMAGIIDPEKVGP